MAKSGIWSAMLAAMLLAGGCSEAPQGERSDERAQTQPRAESSETAAAAALHALFEEEWANRLSENPLFASRVGETAYNERLPAIAPADHARRLEQDRGFLERLQGIDRTALTPDDRLNYDLFAWQLEQRIAHAQFRDWRIPLNSDSGFHVSIQRMHEAMPFRTAADYEAYLTRLQGLESYINQQIANMRLGLETGFTLPREILDGILPSLEGPLVDDPTASVFYEPFADIPGQIPAAARERLASEGAGLIGETVIPAFAAFHDFFVEEYMPGARTTLGASDLPEGEDYYRNRLRFYTTLPEATAQSIHETGLGEVARIRAEMDAIIEEVGFEGSFEEFLAFLRTDERFYVKEPAQLLKEAAWLAKTIDGKLPGFFGTLPRQPYGVREVPPDLAPNYTTGRYWGSPLEGRTGGFYMVNTYAVEQRPLYTLPALTLHEAVPGHHLQNALAKELEGVPEFRRYFRSHAFGEGWGLYSEKLGIEMGMYDTPYEHFGRLTYEMWRACRLVIDTGVHAMGWSRQQARDYLASNTALGMQNVRTEVDRYIGWPGQALAYKMGEIAIVDMRRQAEEALGAEFEIGAFHDTLLGAGPVPLPILRQRIVAYIERGGALESD